MVGRLLEHPAAIGPNQRFPGTIERVPVRALFVNPSPVRGGAEEMLIAMCRGFDPARVAPEVACLADGPFPDDLEAAHLIVHRMRAGRMRHMHRTARAVRDIARLARERDMVFSWQVKGHWYGTPAARLARRPAAWWDHGIRKGRGEKGYVLEGMAPRSLRADAVVCSSRAAAAAIPGAIAIHPGIDVSRFALPETERDGARAELGIAPDQTAVGIVGRLQPWKGQHVFLRAAARLANRSGVLFFVIGDAIGGFSESYPEHLRSLARTLGIPDRVRFPGHRSDVPRVLAALDVFVHASMAEPFGITIVEAMAAGKPVVATRGGGVEEIVTDNETGLLVEHGDDAAMAAAVARYLDEPSLASRVSSAGRAAAEARFTTDRMIAETTDLIERVSAPRSAARS